MVRDMEDQTNESIILKPNIWKLLAVFFVCLLFSAGALVLLVFRQHQFSMADKFIGYLSFLFFGFGTVLFLYKLITRKPTLIITSKGLFPSYLIKSAQQLILWEDILKVDKVSVARYRNIQYYLAIYLKNPEKYSFDRYISKQISDGIRKSLGGLASDGIKGDLYIPSILLPMRIEKVLEILKKILN